MKGKFRPQAEIGREYFNVKERETSRQLLPLGQLNLALSVYHSKSRLMSWLSRTFGKMELELYVNDNYTEPNEKTGTLLA